MFGEYVFGNSPASYANLIWINDVDYLNRITSYSDVFEQHGFDVIEYSDDLSLRIGYEQKIKAVKDLQEEYDRRSEIEEQAFALLAEGKIEEAGELLKTLDDEIKKENINLKSQEQWLKNEYEKLYTKYCICVEIIVSIVTTILVTIFIRKFT